MKKKSILAYYYTNEYNDIIYQTDDKVYNVFLCNCEVYQIFKQRSQWSNYYWLDDMQFETLEQCEEYIIKDRIKNPIPIYYEKGIIK